MDTIKKGLIKCNFQDTNWHRSSLILFLYPDQNNLELYATLEKKQKKKLSLCNVSLMCDSPLINRKQEPPTNEA